MVPYAVIRSNNIPLEYLSKLVSSERIEALYSQIQTEQKRLASAQVEVEHELYEMAAKNEQYHKQIIKFKRKVTSGKLQDIGKLFNALECRDALPLTASWVEQQDEYARLQQHFKTEILSAKLRSRDFISDVLQNDLFYKSLCFSGLNLVRLAKKYPGSALAENKKNLNDEETLLKYISRAITKVSPFSGFTSVGFSKIANTQRKPVSRSKWVYGSYNIDKSLLLKVLRKVTTEEIGSFNYKITGNVVEKNGELLFYCFADNQESYSFNAQVNELKLVERQWLYDLFKSPVRSGKELIEGATKMGAHAAIAHLIEKGLIVADIHIDDMSEAIIEKMLAFLAPIKSEKVMQLVAYLNDLNHVYQQLNDGSHAELSELVYEFDQIMLRCASLYGINSVKHSGFVYHNTYAHYEGNVPRSVVTKIGDDLRAFYDSYLGKAVIDYINTPCLEKIKAHLLEVGTSDIFSLFDLVKKYGGLGKYDPYDSNNPVYELYASLWTNQGKEEIEIQAKDATSDQRISTLSAYGSLVGNEFVLNNIDSGYLRTYSRFFTFANLSSEVQQCVESYGDKLTNAYDFYESFGFNTASRPRLAQGRIWLDNTENAKNGDICLKDLGARWNTALDQPELFNMHSGEVVNIRHTALFIPQLYPKLLEFIMALSTLGEAKYYTMRAGLLMSMMNYPADNIAHFPRLKFRNLVVLRKQSWVPQGKMPPLSNQLSDEDFLLEFNQWREENGIPSRCFMRVYNKAQSGQRNISNNRKPIYVDFFSPIMARSIMKLCRSDFDFYVFEESLPDMKDDFSVIADRGYASELIIETNTGETADVAA
ncbi:hypothetical protein JF50_20260 [Pseudoalteromonas luteoviolacea]|uniref:Uncharacterized protein n=1 Tax=Pseudoalteromonas luteoviolacea TaxID=43657 RepID=A0A0C1QKG5_9GAMM|nr:lantibiotic dehydratase [Pseudoalteromonas luteoviolacea]KID55542.1 hypothetical protein JF50_20260 [Pseudoalteromonas luteoviolacea]